MGNNRIQARLGEADLQAVLAAIETIRTKLPFLIDLSPSERKGLAKMGDKSRVFVQRAAALAAQADSFLPRAFDVAGMQDDVALYGALEEIHLALAPLVEKLDDTRVQVGSEAYAAALAVYQYAKVSGHGEALDSVADDLGRRFARKSTPPPPPASS